MERKSRPTIRPEKALAERIGSGLIAGVDEAGRGPIAGPVVAAAVIFDPQKRRPVGLNDSKKLTASERTRLADAIRRHALAYGIGVASAQEIDLLNILEATRLAATRAIRAMGLPPAGLVTDYLSLPELALPTDALVRGDSLSVSVAAASILAKTHRDALMEIYHEDFPQYGLDRHKGYPTAEHYAAIAAHGPSSIHRLTFAGVDFFCGTPCRSRRYQLIASRLACLRADDAATLTTLHREVEEQRATLPPPEYDDLAEQILLRLQPPGNSL